MRQNPILEKIEAEQIRVPGEFNVGDTVRVHNKIKEGNRERVQMFEGVVMKIQNGGLSKAQLSEKALRQGCEGQGDHLNIISEYKENCHLSYENDGSSFCARNRDSF